MERPGGDARDVREDLEEATPGQHVVVEQPDEFRRRLQRELEPPEELEVEVGRTKRTRTPRAARPSGGWPGPRPATTRRNAASRRCDASQACGEAAPDDGSDEEEDKEEEEEEGEEDVEEEDADGLADDDKDDDEEDGEASPSTAKRQTHISRGSTEEKASARTGRRGCLSRSGSAPPSRRHRRRRAGRCCHWAARI